MIGLEREEEWILDPSGVEDPRVTKIGDIYYIVYATTSALGDRIALATTRDFKTVEKHGLLQGYFEQRTAGLFPEKINGKFVLLHRLTPNIWISESEDLKTFSQPTVILQPDAQDPVCREFYGLSPFVYGDVFLATLAVYDTEPTEKGRFKMQGTNQVHLAYSYNGQNWYRASRDPFIPRTEPGTHAGLYNIPEVRTAVNFIKDNPNVEVIGVRIDTRIFSVIVVYADELLPSHFEISD